MLTIVVLGGLLVALLALGSRLADSDDRLERWVAVGLLGVELVAAAALTILQVAGFGGWPFRSGTVALPMSRSRSARRGPAGRRSPSRASCCGGAARAAKGDRAAGPEATARAAPASEPGIRRGGELVPALLGSPSTGSSVPGSPSSAPPVTGSSVAASSVAASSVTGTPVPSGSDGREPLVMTQAASAVVTGTR